MKKTLAYALLFPLAVEAVAMAACAAPAPSAAKGSVEGRVPRGALPVQAHRSATSNEASVDDPVRAAIAPLLDGFESAPSKEALLSHGDAEAVTRALISIEEDASQPTIRRLRAVSLLGFFPSEPSRKALESAMAGPAPVRLEAVNAYGNAFREQSVARLSEMLSHDDPFTRIAAIKALGATGAPQARAAIERRLDVETAESVRRAASATLSRQVP